MYPFHVLFLLGLLFTGEYPRSSGSAPSAKLFAPGIISRADAWSFTPALSQDGNTLYYVRWENPDYGKGAASRQRLYRSQRVNGTWTEPAPVPETEKYRVDYPHFSPDGKCFLLSYNAYHGGQFDYPNQDFWDDFDLWIADATPAGEVDWASFRPLSGSDVNRPKTPANLRTRYVHNETSPRLDLAGNLYFWSERLDDGGGLRDVYRAAPAALRNSSNQEEELTWGDGKLLPAPINSTARESGICVHPSGDWIIFSSARPGGFGGEDLYFSRSLGEDNWSTPVNLGPSVNSTASDFCPQLTADGATLFFTSNRKTPGVTPLDAGEGRAVSYAIFTVGVAELSVFRE